MRKQLMIAALVALSLTAEAGLFDRKEKKVTLKPAVGYVEKTELVTNSWSEAVSLHKAGPVTTNLRTDSVNYSSLTISGSWGVCVTNTMTVNINGTEFREDGIYWGRHKCEECDKAHISDWPKTLTESVGIQKRVTTTVYKDGKDIVKIVEHTYPHKKITTKKTKRIEFKTDVEVIKEDTNAPSK